MPQSACLRSRFAFALYAKQQNRQKLFLWYFSDCLSNGSLRFPFFFFSFFRFLSFASRFNFLLFSFISDILKLQKELIEMCFFLFLLFSFQVRETSHHWNQIIDAFSSLCWPITTNITVKFNLIFLREATNSSLIFGIKIKREIMIYCVV